MAKFNVRTFVKKNTLPALIKRMQLEQSKSAVKIGFQEDAKTEKKTSKVDGVEFTNLDALTVVEVATFHEFGTETIPQRSFIRSNDKNNYQKYRRMIEEIKDKIIFGELKPAQGLALLGEQIRLDIQQKIRSGLQPELKEATIKRKGSSKPLIDTGQLINSISYKVTGASDE